tara:strand:+ start:20356 stop:23124 length:2769 start_codon:yes stop_codon:yes gene_type:complete
MIAKNNLFILGIFLFSITISLVTGISNKNIVEIEESLLKNFEDLEENSEKRIRVIIEFKGGNLLNKKFKSNDFKKNSGEKINLKKENIKHDLGNRVSAFITKGELEELKSSGLIKIIKAEKFFHVSLQDSIGLINASKTWDLQDNNLNLTGLGQTVCLIDTGVNYTHTDLGGCFGENNISSNCKIIGGWDYCADDVNCTTEDSDPMDVEGHGTHVSGIVGANGSIKGIAPDIKIVMLKAGNSSGVFGATDIEASINWCVNNATKFNISVISMSLGGGLETDSCDSSDPEIATAIDNAFINNISVVVSTGNEGNSTAINSPACIFNATPVSSKTKAEEISSFSNRNNLTKLFAIGSDINSTCIAGGYCLKDGTSMATPMVAGAFAIFNQYLNLTNQTKTPLQIEDIFYDNGLKFSENSNNFSRIDLYSSILSIDLTSPEVSLISPINNKINSSSNQTFICNSTDWQLSNVTFNIWNSSELYYNETKNISGTTNQSSFNMTNIPNGTYSWNCKTYDLISNSNFSISNYSITLGELSTTLLSPSDETYSNKNETNFTCQSDSEDSYLLSNVTFNIWNSSRILVYSQTKNISGITNQSVFNYTIPSETNYSWNCLTENNNSNKVSASNNFTVIYDTTKPTISSLSESVSTTTSTITWETTGDPSNYSITGDISENSSNYDITHSSSFSGLTSSTTYNYNLTSCDQTGNCANTTNSFTTNSQSVSPEGGSGGGSSEESGGGEIVETEEKDQNVIEEAELIEGINKILKEEEEIILNLSSNEHTILIKNINLSSSQVTILIKSEPIELILLINQEAKINLTSPNYYDLYIKLNNITENEANITIKKISEEIKFSKTKEISKNKRLLNILKNIKGLKQNIFRFKSTFYIGFVIIIMLSLLSWQFRRRKKLKRQITFNKDNENKRKKFKT